MERDGKRWKEIKRDKKRQKVVESDRKIEIDKRRQKMRKR